MCLALLWQAGVGVARAEGWTERCEGGRAPGFVGTVVRGAGLLWAGRDGRLLGTMWPLC